MDITIVLDLHKFSLQTIKDHHRFLQQGLWQVFLFIQ